MAKKVDPKNRFTWYKPGQVQVKLKPGFVKSEDGKVRRVEAEPKVTNSKE